MSFRMLALQLAVAVAIAPAATYAADKPTQSDEVRFITLGTGGGPVIRKERSEPANVLQVGDALYMFDIGTGSLRRLAEAGLDPRHVRAVFLSHLHIDHTADLAPFLLNRWVLSDYRKIPVIGPRGTRETLNGVVTMSGPIRLAPTTIGGPAKPNFADTYRPEELPVTMDRPAVVFDDGSLRVLAATNAHYNFPPGSAEARAARSYAFRIEAGNKSYVFTGDTGVSENLVNLARGADVLVSEVIDMKGIEVTLAHSGLPANALPSLLAHMRQDHLTPQQVGMIARQAGVKRVVLTHIVPGNDGETDLSVYVSGVSEFFDGPVSVARDLASF